VILLKKKHLQGLIFLDLDNNPITNFSEDSFKDFEKLKYLNLSGIPQTKNDKEASINVNKLFQGTNQETKQSIRMIHCFHFILESSFENPDQLLEIISLSSYPI
jgi:hypothetical protein